MSFRTPKKWRNVGSVGLPSFGALLAELSDKFGQFFANGIASAKQIVANVHDVSPQKITLMFIKNYMM